MMPANDRREVLLLLAIFAMHNIEEIAHFSQDVEALPDWVKESGPWHDVRSFATATGLLTATVGAASCAGLKMRGRPRTVLLGIPAAALAGNAVSHITRALIQRRYVGGLVTAPAMGLIAARVFTTSTQSFSTPTRRWIFLAGNILALPAILGSLSLGRYFLPVAVRA